MQHIHKRIEAINTLGAEIAQNSPGSVEWLEAVNIAIQVLLSSELERLTQTLENAEA